MTERLYYTDAYLAAFDARVVERGSGGRRLYLDRTAFYPTSGGQPHDLGTIADVPIEDVVDEDGRVAHLVTEPVGGEAVHCEVDWPRRFDLMQQHTGQHLISALFADCFGHQTMSVHFGEESSTLDLDSEHVADDCLRETERRANDLIVEGRPVAVSFEDAMLVTGLRKPPDREGMLRVVSIAGVDRSACGGTHVRHTGEIGLVLLRRQEKVRKGTRIEFVCGLRGVRRARRDFEMLSSIAQHLSASTDEAFRLVEGLTGQLKDLQKQVRRLDGELQGHHARKRHAATTPNDRGLRYIVERHAIGSPDEWRAFALAFCALPESAFIVATETPPAVLLAASEDSGIDAGKTLKAALEAVGGRGGGSPRLAQGSVPSKDDLDRVIRALTP